MSSLTLCVFINQRDLAVCSCYCCVVRAKDIIAHCKIERRPKGYGFAEPYHVHESLKSLVRHYRQVSLVEHNPLLDVTLALPVNAASQSHEASSSVYQVNIHKCIQTFLV